MIWSTGQWRLSLPFPAISLLQFEGYQVDSQNNPGLLFDDAVTRSSS